MARASTSSLGCKAGTYLDRSPFHFRDTHTHTHTGGNQSTQRTPMQTWGECADSTEIVVPAWNQIFFLLINIRTKQCYWWTCWTFLAFPCLEAPELVRRFSFWILFLKILVKCLLFSTDIFLAPGGRDREEGRTVFVGGHLLLSTPALPEPFFPLRTLCKDNWEIGFQGWTLSTYKVGLYLLLGFSVLDMYSQFSNKKPN